ncbi:MAG: NfeD family protein [Thermoleophilia bacterium]
MSAWLVWLLGALALVVGEAMTLGLWLGFAALGAGAAAVAAGAGGGLLVQLAVFVVVTLLLIVLVRPVARRHLRMPAQLRSGAEALVGATALVIERVDADGGQVKIGGEIWSARAWDSSTVLEPGTRVEVMEIKGATALVHE